MDVPCSLSELKPADPNSSAQAQALALPPTSWAAHPMLTPLPAWGSPDPEPPLHELCRLWVELAVLHRDGQTLLQAALPEQAACSCFRARNVTGGIEQVVSRHFFCGRGNAFFFQLCCQKQLDHLVQIKAEKQSAWGSTWHGKTAAQLTWLWRI